MKALTREEVIDIIKFWRSNPVEFVKQVLGVKKIDAQQIKVLETLPFNKFIAVKSGHGVGKTALESWIILWFLACYSNSKILCIAPTEDQLTKILWPEINKWLDRSTLKSYIKWTKTKIYVIGEESISFASYRTASKPESLQGFHEDNMLLILEEASGIEDALWEPVEGALTSKNSRAICLGNPTKPMGEFYRAFTDRSNLWTKFTISGVDSSLVSREYIERAKVKYGIDSDAYRVRVLGEFPKTNSNSFIPLYLCEESLKYTFDKVPFFKMGVDIARFGDDYSVWLIRDDSGNIRHCERRQTMDTMEIAGRTIQLINEYRIMPEQVALDVIGVGGGVVDRLTEQNLAVRGVNVGVVPIDQDLYFNKRIELWGIVKQELTDKKLSLVIEGDSEMTSDLCGELASPLYKFTSKGQYQLESKEDMKKRGVGSPDLADALMLTYAVGNVNNAEDKIMSNPSIRYGEGY